jgi:hypothetical protein
MFTAFPVTAAVVGGGVIATVTAAGAPDVSQPERAKQANTTAEKMNMACGGNILITHPPFLRSSGQLGVPTTVGMVEERSISASTEQSRGIELGGACQH